MSRHIESSIEFLVDAHKGIHGLFNLAEIAFKRIEIFEDLLAFSSLMSNRKELHHTHRVSKTGEMLFLLSSHSCDLLALYFTRGTWLTKSVQQRVW